MLECSSVWCSQLNALNGYELATKATFGGKAQNEVKASESIDILSRY